MAVEHTPELGPGEINVFEARFGDKNGALALLHCPAHLREFFIRILDKVDLPDTAPPGSTWEPFLRGWREDDHYLITLTQEDRTAARPGMIATRAIAIPLAGAERLGALDAIFDFLRDPHRDYIPELTIPIKQDTRLTSPTTLLTCVVHRLIQDDKPLAVMGQSGFEPLITALWRRLPPDLRRSFAFGFSFTPTDLIVSGANVVAVPVSCETRWRSYKQRCDGNWNQSLDVPTAAFLSESQARDFLEFLREVGLVFRSFPDYGRYARLWADWQARNEDDPEVSYALLRNLGTLLPIPEQGAKQKVEALKIAAGWLVNATSQGILAQRSVKADSFPASAEVLEDAICEWLKSSFHSPSSVSQSDLRSVISAISSSQSAQWQRWIRKGLRQAFSPLNEMVARKVRSVWSNEATFTEICAQLPVDNSTEGAMIRAIPGVVSDSLYQSLQKWCTERGWISLLARSAIANHGFAKALQLVLDHGKGSALVAAIELLCAAAKPSEVWAGVFEHNDPTLFKAALATAEREPSLWASEAPNLKRWVELLDSTARANPYFLVKADANAVTARLFAAWENGESVTNGICDALEKVGKLDFSGYGDRHQLWPRVPKRSLASALTNTLRAWLQDYYSHLPKEPVLETALVAVLFVPSHIGFTFPVHCSTLGIGGLLLVETWGKERECELWLRAIMASSVALPADVATRAGALVTENHWVNVAKFAKDCDERRGRHDLGAVWRAYYESLGRLEKFFFNYIPSFSRSSADLQISAPTQDMIDAVFVTALPEEFSAVKAHLIDCHEHIENGTIYEIGRFRDGDVECDVAVVQTGMGNAPSAAATERALNLFKPTFAFFVGIAGGLRDDLKIGDVVAANKVYGYESGKSGEKFQPRPEAQSVSHEADQHANAVKRDNLWQKRITPLPQNIPSAVIRPIAAGEKVLTSEEGEDLKRIRETYTDAHAVAMEDHGFAVAVKAHPRVCFAVVRGISDLIENKDAADRSGSHETAVRSAAAFAFEMLVGLLRGRRISQRGK